jgi:hypothetical protein
MLFVSALELKGARVCATSFWQGVQKTFIEDVLEDLQLMDEGRIAGLGVTIDDLCRWQGSLDNR